MTPVPDAGDRVVFFGSGAFGVPVLERLADAGRVSLVVSQPDRPAGRGRAEQPTPIAAEALRRGLPMLRCADACAEPALTQIREKDVSAFVVIAFGQKLTPSLLRDRFAVNLHGSVLPRWRGAAPIQRALMEGDREVGVSVIALAERMDAGEVFAVARTEVLPGETAGELHDRLAQLGPDLIDDVLARHADGSLRGEAQDESRATRARKLARADAWVDLTAAAERVAARINGLSPWPGCDARIGEEALRLVRARAGTADSNGANAPGTLRADGSVVCGEGSIELIEVQSPGGRVMPFEEWRRGRRLAEGATLRSAAPESLR